MPVRVSPRVGEKSQSAFGNHTILEITPCASPAGSIGWPVHILAVKLEQDMRLQREHGKLNFLNRMSKPDEPAPMIAGDYRFPAFTPFFLAPERRLRVSTMPEKPMAK
jgi:hypothetical protein